jgi:hypothetical protein
MIPLEEFHFPIRTPTAPPEPTNDSLVQPLPRPEILPLTIDTDLSPNTIGNGRITPKLRPPDLLMITDQSTPYPPKRKKYAPCDIVLTTESTEI